MGLTLEEQETTIHFMRDSNICRIYTSDTTMITKLDKLANNDECPLWKVVEEHKLKNGAIIAKTYETNKRLISFRKDITTKTLTDEQRKDKADRIRNYQLSRKDESSIE